MAWVFVLIAGLLEVGWTIGMKASDGFTRPLVSVITGLTMLASFGLLSLGMRTLPMGTAYTVWTGIGAVGSVIAGMILFGEPRDAGRIACLALIILGMSGLKLLSR